MRPSLWLIGALFACGPADDRGPQVVRVLVREDESFAFADELLATLASARHVRGGAATLRGGGQLVLEETLVSGELDDDTDDVQQAALVSGDDEVVADYLEQDGVLVPRDYETLLMFTTYRHIERGLAFFDDLGAPAAARARFLAYFDVRFTAMLAWGLPLISDNAAYAPLADALLLFPSRTLDEGVPLCANDGVVVHELAHGIKHRILHPGSGTPIYLEEGWDRVAANSYRADDEGLADYFAAVFTGDPNFIQASTPGLDLDRDLRKERPFSAELYAELGDDFLGYNPYRLGSALASFLWNTAGDDLAARRALARAAIAALLALRGQLDSRYRITDLIDLLVARTTPELRQRACARLQLLLEGGFRNVPTCGILE